MFWQINYAPSVQIDTLLSEENITLHKLMDAEDILQECKNQNKKLIDYLTRSEILEELVNLITEEPSKELEERLRYKYSNVACELLTCEGPKLTEKLAGNEMLLSKLYSFIDNNQPLNPLLASFFSKTLHALLRRASDQNWFSHQFVCLQVLESLKSRKNCVDLLLQHIQTSAIMDLFLILLTKIEGDEMRQNILKWLDDQHLVQRLVKLLSPIEDCKKHTNASQLLCDIVKCPCMELDKRPDPILQTLRSEETIKMILDTILTEVKLESSIVGGVRILINLLGQKESKNTESSEVYGGSFNNIVENEQRNKFALTILPYLDRLNLLLLDPPEKPAVKTTAGFLEKPFGLSRLYILKLYVSLLSTENPKVLQDFAELNTFNILMDLFIHFVWNNFLHTQVQHCISSAINSHFSETTEILYASIFIRSQLIERILETWDSDNKQNEKNKIRQGYMGHLISIANEIVRCYEENDFLLNFLKTNLSQETMQKWENFTSITLNEINKKQQLTLGDPLDNYLMSSSGNSDEYTSFPQISYEQDMYNNYQDSPITPSFNDDSNFQIEKFNGKNDTFKNFSDQLNQTFPDDDYEKKQELFDKICFEKTFDNPTQDEEWNSNPVLNKQKSLNWLCKKNHDSSSSDEEGEYDSHNLCLEDNTTEIIDFLRLSSEEITSIDLWKTMAPEPVEQTGWASFDNLNSAFSANISFEIQSSEERKTELLEEPNIMENLSSLERNFEKTLCKNKKKEDTDRNSNDSKQKAQEFDVSSIIGSKSFEPANLPDSDLKLTTEKKILNLQHPGEGLEKNSSNETLSSECFSNVFTVLNNTEKLSIPPYYPESSE